jgi:hypothetical protein
MALKVKIKKDKDKYNIYACTVDGEEKTPLNISPFDSEEIAITTAIIKGYDLGDKMPKPKKTNPIKNQEVPRVKHEKSKEMDLGNEREIKLENLVRRIYNELTINEQYTETDLKFVNGKASIKKNGKEIAIVIHRPVYYKKQKVVNNTTKDYAVKSTKGFQECRDVKEVLDFLNKNYSLNKLVNEMDYSRPEPKVDKLKKGSVITVEGWIMLKGLDEGSYYVVTDVDDSTYTFRKSNKNGKPNNSFGNKVRFYKTTIDRNIDTMNNHRIIIIKDGGITESIIFELDITDPTLVAELETMADLAEKMDRMAAEMAALTKQFKPLDEKFTAMIDAIDENKERVLRTKNVLVTIKKKGYEAKSPKYKEIFELLYGKVNGKMKKIADDLMKANTTIKKISSSIATQKLNSESKLNEGMLSNLWNKVKNYITSFTSKIKQQGQSVDADLEKLEKLSLK